MVDDGGGQVMGRVRAASQSDIIVTDGWKAVLRPERRQFARQGCNRQRRNGQPSQYRRELASEILACANDVIEDAGRVERIDG
ncbi:MAG: hypothetical protein E5V59_12115 [Mesorhizobium sp.]|nr:MAG: hypothetical protein E5V59_12115 [Mesorhizobium sp.]